jgi:hypothetical protein
MVYEGGCVASLWKFNRNTREWVIIERDVPRDAAREWLTVFRENEPREYFVIAVNRPTGKPLSYRLAAIRNGEA